jgi:hypothetical protein
MIEIFCYGEGAAFSESEFVHRSDGSLLTPEVHDRGIPHYKTGGLLFPDPPPDLGASVRDWAKDLALPSNDLNSFTSRILEGSE